MTIWIFGDSFVQEHDIDYQWYKQLSKFTGMDVNAIGYAGMPNSWIGEQIFNAMPDFKPGDWIIQVQTQQTRQWFFADRPHLSNFQNHTDPTKIGMSKEEYNACKNWLTHLYNPRSLAWNTYTTSGWLAAIASELDCKCISIPGFLNTYEPVNPYCTIDGALTECISYLEFASREEYDRALATPGIGDPRPNHLNEKNHRILAHRVAEIIEGKSNHLDLVKGWDTVRTLSPEDFITYE
jgi:hypothetical protein